MGPPPDPTHIPTVLPKDIKWTGQEGKQQMGLLFGDPNKAGLYGVSTNGIRVISLSRIFTIRSVTRT